VGFLKRELGATGVFLKTYKNEAIVLGTAMLALCLKTYHPLGAQWISELVYFLLLPLLIIVLILRKNPLEFGLRPGDIRKWGAYVGITCMIGAPILYAASRMSQFQSYYDLQNFDFLRYFLTTIATLTASEFLFRGFLIFGLKERLKEASILVQMVPFVLVHLGKPELETLSTILTGILFGFIVYRTKSFWPALIIHLFINIFFVVSVNLLYIR
jgi:membrane protease YdiL (CAAX protease family)